MDIYSETDIENDLDPEEFNSKKRKLLGEGVFESFMHPKQIKVGKIVLKNEMKNQSKNQLTEEKKSSNDLPTKQRKHKFNVI